MEDSWFSLDAFLAEVVIFQTGTLERSPLRYPSREYLNILCEKSLFTNVRKFLHYFTIDQSKIIIPHTSCTGSVVKRKEFSRNRESGLFTQDIEIFTQAIQKNRKKNQLIV